MFLLILTYLVLVLLLTYLLFVLWMGYQMRRLLSVKLVPGKTRSSIAVIIPFRNEEDRLRACILGLVNQEYQELQILLVDDNSSDRSGEIAAQLADRYSNITSFKLKNDKGKKAALELGISHAQADWIITRDADTTCQADNIAAINQLINSEPKKQMFVLPVTTHINRDFLADLLGMEFHSLIASGLACAKGGIPIMANGANFAFSKSLFNQLEGYRGNRHIASGDDTSLLFKTVQFDSNLIGVSADQRCSVNTMISSSLGGWFSQRARWGGKFRLQSSPANSLVALLIFSANLALVTALLGGLYDPLNIGLIWTLKLASDTLLVFPFLNRFEKNRPPHYFLILGILFPFLLVVSAIAGLVHRPKWKGRKIEN